MLLGMNIVWTFIKYQISHFSYCFERAVLKDIKLTQLVYATKAELL